MICEAAGGLTEGMRVWKTLWVGNKNSEIHLGVHQEPMSLMGAMSQRGKGANSQDDMTNCTLQTGKKITRMNHKDSDQCTCELK